MSRNLISIVIIWFLFFVCLIIQKPGFYKFDFNPEKLTATYLKSQDIYDPQGEIKDRVFVSDSEIYLASGYLYSVGADPAAYNFQHPPLVKYLYGFSLRLFQNPYVLQIVFSFAFFVLSYFLALKIIGDRRVSVLTLILISLDPLMADSVYNVYLDLGQTVFGLAFVLAYIFKPSSWIIQGLLFGLLLSSKFWSVSIFLMLILTFYRLYSTKNIRVADFLKMLAVSGTVYLLTYINFFIHGNGLIDFVWMQLKMLGFMLSHNSVSSPGGQIILFLTGMFDSWWRNGGLANGNVWSILWPLSFIALCYGLVIRKLRKKFILPAIIVFGFFIATFFGAPFTRYLIFILPYLYIVLSIVIFHFLSKIFKSSTKNLSVSKHFDRVAKDYDYYKKKNSFYYDNLKKLLKSLIPSNKNVLEIGCGTGDLLTSLKPKTGVGYDISSEMIRIAKYKYKSKNNLSFTHYPLSIIHYSFDFVFMSDVIEHLDHPEETFKKVSKVMGNDTKFVITMANPIWEPFLMLAEKLKLKMPEGEHYRIKYKELRIMLEKTGMKIARHGYELLIPVKIPFITNFANKYLEKPLKKLAFIEFFVVTKY